MSEEDLSMWTYWRDKKGVIDALVDYYPSTLAGTLALRRELLKLRTSERRIDEIMRRLRDKEAE